MITEIGGTVGDIESLPFLEAIRQFPVDVGRRNCMYIHLTLVPYIGHAGELKTKPTQHSVNELRRIGIQPDMLLCRSEGELEPRHPQEDRAVRLAAGRGGRLGQGRRQHLQGAAVVPRTRASTTSSASTSGSRRRDGRPRRVGASSPSARDAAPTRRSASRSSASTSQLEDAYLSVVRGAAPRGLPARRARSRSTGSTPRRSTTTRRAARASPAPTASSSPAASAAAGSRARSARRASPASGRSRTSGSAWACRSRSASSPATWPTWRARTPRSSTPRRRTPSSTCCPSRRRSPTSAARCASAPTRSSCTPARGRASSTSEAVIYERHRHRYEVNILLRKRLEAAGLSVSGTSPDERLVEVIELDDHPFFVASQYHPEFKSRPERPAPLFREFVGAALRARGRGPGAPCRRTSPQPRGCEAG